VIELEIPPTLSASVDWYSASLAASDDRAKARTVFNALAAGHEAHGVKREETQWKGYDLTRVGHVRYGIRQQDDYLELQSDAAAQWWLAFEPMVSHVARIDLAVTWKPPRPRANLAHSLYQRVGLLPDRGHNPPQLRYWETWQSGQTFYLGSVKSDRMGRIYDKGAQLRSLDPGVLWRFEVQLRNDPANVTARALAKDRSRGHMIAALVATFFRQRRVDCEWAADLEDVPVVVHRNASDIESTKRWLMRTVAPVVARVGKELTRGEVFGLLGLSELA
jgi:DNA relaxase NicK